MTPGAALLVALLSQRPADPGAAPAGAAAPTRLRLEVRAAPGCTSRDDLTSRIAARSTRIAVVDEAPLSARVAITTPRSGRLVGDVVLGGGGAEPSARRVVAQSCAEAADAIALIIAVTLDPNVKSQSAIVSPKDRPAEGAGAAGSSAPIDDAAAASRAPATEAAAIAPPASRPPAPATIARPPAPIAQPLPPAPSAPPATKRELGIGLAGQAIAGPAPSVMPGIGIYVMGALDRGGWFAPALILGAAHAWRSDLAQTGGTASFALDVASFDACPLRWSWAWLALRPCASALVGRLLAQGSDTPQAARTSRPFAAAGAALVAGVGGRIEVSGRLGLGVTVIRDAYEFGNDVFHRAGALTISVGLGAGVRWR